MRSVPVTVAITGTSTGKSLGLALIAQHHSRSSLVDTTAVRVGNRSVTNAYDFEPQE
jgi:hypothetical protein